MKTYEAFIKDGQLVNRELSRDLAGADGVKVMLTVAEWGTKPRSNPQNRYLFGMVYPKVAKYYTANVGDFIRDVLLAMKAKVTAEFIHELMKMMFNGSRTTTKLSTVGMMEYITLIREYFYHKYELDIPEPNSSCLPREDTGAPPASC